MAEAGSAVVEADKAGNGPLAVMHQSGFVSSGAVGTSGVRAQPVAGISGSP